MLLKLCRDSKVAALYIPVEKLEAIGTSIKNYCARVLFDGDVPKLEEYASIKYAMPNLILLVDGLNEVNARAERQFINELKGLNLLSGIQFVVTSRSDFTA